MSCSGKGNNFNFNQCGGAENITITLYKAEWCGHCKSFAPEWQRLQSMVKGMSNITLKTCDDQNNKAEIAALKDKNLFKGFPTIIITRSSQDKEYKGDRTAEAILASVGIKPQNQIGGNYEAEGMQIPSQCGGSRKDDNYYKMKYLKYKAKYMLARSRLEN